MDNYSNEETISRIIKLTEGLVEFWGNSYGWATIDSTNILTKSRLDWQASLSRQLKLFLNEETIKESGALILAWTTLGSLTEGIMKLFLSIWYENYKEELNKKDISSIRRKNGIRDLIEPDELVLDNLRVFFQFRVYPKKVREIWKKEGQIDWIDWILKIQNRRNAIHAFKHREIGTFDEFYIELRNYLDFMRLISSTFPYPDEIYIPLEY